MMMQTMIDEAVATIFFQTAQHIIKRQGILMDRPHGIGAVHVHPGPLLPADTRLFRLWLCPHGRLAAKAEMNMRIFASLGAWWSDQCAALSKALSAYRDDLAHSAFCREQAEAHYASQPTTQPHTETTDAS